MITVVPTGGANITSVLSCLERQNIPYKLSQDPNEVYHASKVLLPGVGYAKTCMQKLDQQNLVDVLKNFRNPLLGICLGMQILFESSEEGDSQTLGVIPGKIKKIPYQDHPIPHMGWNLTKARKSNPLMKDSEYFYFVHSYMAEVGSHTIAECEYGIPISAMVQKDNFFGVQFHPERSAAEGAKILERFNQL